MVKKIDLIEQFKDISLECEITPKSFKLSILQVTNHVLEEIKDDQKLDLHLFDQLALINQGRFVEFNVVNDGLVIIHNRICVSNISVVKRLTLE